MINFELSWCCMCLLLSICREYQVFPQPERVMKILLEAVFEEKVYLDMLVFVQHLTGF